MSITFKKKQKITENNGKYFIASPDVADFFKTLQTEDNVLGFDADMWTYDSSVNQDVLRAVQKLIKDNKELKGKMDRHDDILFNEGIFTVEFDGIVMTVINAEYSHDKTIIAKHPYDDMSLSLNSKGVDSDGTAYVSINVETSYNGEVRSEIRKYICSHDGIIEDKTEKGGVTYK